MLPTYPATLHSGRLEWESDNPPNIPPGASIRVHVTLLTDSDEFPATGSAMAIALADFAADGGPIHLSDPVEWQRQSCGDMPKDKFSLYTQALFLGRLVCTRCGTAAVEHPAVARSDSSAGRADWAEALAEHCLSEGWQTTAEQGSSQVLCPACIVAG